MNPNCLRFTRWEVNVANILFGIVFIVGGLSGKLALRGTESGPALAAVGMGLLIWGAVQVVRGRQNKE